jgi:hypothetical protein
VSPGAQGAPKLADFALTPSPFRLPRRLYRSYTRHRLTALAKDETASGQARHFARVQQDALDSAHPPYEEAGKFALTTRNSVVRTALAVLFEVLAGGVGTLLWPGWGTLGFSTLGGVTVQLFM